MPFALTKEKFLGRKAMSQNGRREFLTSAAAVAAALAACTAPARRAQAQPACDTPMYDEQGLVNVCAQLIHGDPTFLPALVTFGVDNPSPKMTDLNQTVVQGTLGAINNKMHVSTVTVKKNGGSLHGPPSNFIPQPTDLP